MQWKPSQHPVPQSDFQSRPSPTPNLTPHPAPLAPRPLPGADRRVMGRGRRAPGDLFARRRAGRHLFRLLHPHQRDRPHQRRRRRAARQVRHGPGGGRGAPPHTRTILGRSGRDQQVGAGRWPTRLGRWEHRCVDYKDKTKGNRTRVCFKGIIDESESRHKLFKSK